MVINLSETNSLLAVWISEIRDVQIQTDRLRFRRNLERIGEVAAYEISKQLEYEEKEVQTPLGTSLCPVLKEQPVLATILRAGLPLHQGLLNFFDRADNAFISKDFLIGLNGYTSDNQNTKNAGRNDKFYSKFYTITFNVTSALYNRRQDRRHPRGRAQYTPWR